MKVTVCFGNIPVVVPCGKGDLSIADLQKQACARYRKIIGKGSDYWVQVLQLAVDGGILDWDDLVNDVVEDKEKLIAVYEEEEPQHIDWDVGSVISSEDRTPHRTTPKGRYFLPNGGHSRYVDQGSLGSSYYSRDSSLEVDVGVETLKSNTHIVVRRESDQSLNVLAPRTSSSSLSQSDEPLVNGEQYERIKLSNQTSHHHHHNNHSDDVTGRRAVRSQSSREETKSYFQRDRFRQSMASGLAESIESDGESSDPPAKAYSFESPYTVGHTRSLPSDTGAAPHKQLSFVERLNLPWFYRESQEIILVNDGSALGCRVIPFHDPKTDKFVGLLITSVEAGSRIDVENLLQCGDVIVEINQRVLLEVDPDIALSVLSDAVHSAELQFRILPVEERERHVSSPTRTSRPPSINLTIASPAGANGESAGSLPSTSVSSAHESSSGSSPVPKVPMIAQQSYDNVSLYTRKIGNQFNIPLKKGSQGLGFSITARDTSTTGDPGPIYIKNILPKGAAILDGRLRAGDRLLKVNGQELVGMTQEDSVKILRAVPTGSVVSLTVSRQSETLPRKLDDDPDTDRIISEDNLREYFMFEIALNDTGSAGLGISLKGNQSKKTGKDLGIFVKSVFHGGAAWQDGRLKANDQLVQVNGRSLTGVTNHEAIDVLRASMTSEGNMRGMIQMVIARRKLSPDGATLSRVSSEASSDLSDSVLDQLQNKMEQPRSLHVKQSSMPSLLLETSFGADDISEVTTSFQCTTLDRPSARRGRSAQTGAVARRISNNQQKRSRSMSNDIDKLDVEVVSKVREKILNSSSSSFLSNLIRSSAASPAPASRPVPPTSSYATWTIPRTHRVPKRSLSFKNLRDGEESPTVSPGRTVTDEEPRRSAFDSITANEINPEKEVEYNEYDPHVAEAHSDGPRSSVSSQDFSQKQESNSPVNADVVVGEEDWPSTPSYDPFQRESAARQSISEKRRETVNRFFPNGDASRLQKNKQNTGVQEGERAPGKGHARTISSPLQSPRAKYNSTQNNNNSSTTGNRLSALQQAQPENFVKSLKSKSSDGGHDSSLSGFRKSISTESLVATGVSTPGVGQNKANMNGSRYSNYLDVPDVGPTLGIAKSSSLESLQTAVEACYADENNKDAPYPRALPRVVRGRVLNDSFRAALDRSYDMSGDLPGLKHMETDNDVREDESYLRSTMDDGSKSSDKKRPGGKSTKLFGLFKINKTKRLSDGGTPSKSKVSENELHKKHLEARREKDFERMKEENERIQAKARELRNKQAEEQRRSQTQSNYERPRPPSVPITAMQRIRNDDPVAWQGESPSGRRSVDPSSMFNHRHPTNGQSRSYTQHELPSPPPRTTKQVKRDEQRKFSETASRYSSLPSLLDLESVNDAGHETSVHPQRESRSTDDETPSRGRSSSKPDVITASVRTMSGRIGNPRSASSKLDNLEFYNRQKPMRNVKKSLDGTPKRTLIDNAVPKALPDSSTPMADDKGRTLFYDDTRHASFRQDSVVPSFHRREDSPEPPPQSFYVVQTRGDQPGQSGTSISVRRGPLSPGPRTPKWTTPPSGQRHSVYSETPSSVDYRGHSRVQARTSSFQAESVRSRDKQALLRRSTDRYRDLERTPATIGPEGANAHPDVYHRLVQSRGSNDGQYEKIEVSAPYNL